MKKIKALCLIIQVLYFVNKSVQDLNPVVITSRIVGGRDATRFEFPYMVKIRHNFFLFYTYLYLISESEGFNKKN